MDMYKKAAELKLRFQSSRGQLSVEQLFDFKMVDLARMIKEQNEIVKKTKGDADAELEFLEGTSDGKENVEALKFDILKDIYLDKKHKRDQDAEDVLKREEIKKLEELIAKKQNAALEEMSVEELMKKRDELLKK